MRAEAARRLSQFGGRGKVEPFDLFSGDWQPHLDGADCVLSSLCLHHLDDWGKQALFAAVGRRLSPRGVFLIADLVAPRRPEASELFAATWDRATLEQSLAQTGSPELYEKFRQAHWNYYRFPDPFDKPSAMFDQLLWLKEAGFAVVDCFWLQAGHAIYGGYKQGEAGVEVGLQYELALQTVREALR
jgi:SAM-dependent methyltransferase